MIRLHFVVEGWTEKAFVDNVLAAELATRNVFADARLVQTSSSGGRIHRGGGRHYHRWKMDLHQWMKQDRHAESRFTTMVDLYGLPTDFPGYDECSRLPDRHARVERLERHWAQDISDPRFLPYIQLHEFEALLFADVNQFATVYPSEDERVARLAEVRRPFRTVDDIDDGADTAPSKRVLDVFPEYDKRSAGPLIAASIGVGKMCDTSPHFKQWFEHLQGLDTAQLQ